MKTLSWMLCIPLLALALPAFAQTTVSNLSGGCASAVLCTLPLNGGTGSITFYAYISPNCSFGHSCSFSGGVDGSYFAYALPDGSSATGAKFSGTMTYNATGSCGAECTSYNYTVAGTFSGQDSLGRTFTGFTNQALVIDTFSRGGDSASDTSGTTAITYTSAPTADFSITASPTSLTVATGQSGMITLTLVPQGGFRGTQTFACSGLPSPATCSFNPPTLVADGSNTPLTTQLTINTAATKAENAPASPRAGPAEYQLGAFFLSGVLLCFNVRGRKKAALIAGVLLLAVVGAVSCGSGSSSNSSASSQSQSSSSTVLVTANSSTGIAHSVSINLTVTP